MITRLKMSQNTINEMLCFIIVVPLIFVIKHHGCEIQCSCNMNNENNHENYETLIFHSKKYCYFVTYLLYQCFITKDVMKYFYETLIFHSKKCYKILLFCNLSVIPMFHNKRSYERFLS